MNHDIWKSKKAMGAFFTDLFGIILLLLGTYTEVEVPNVEVIVAAMMAVWPLAVGGWSVEDSVIAGKTGKRALKYGDTLTPE